MNYAPQGPLLSFMGESFLGMGKKAKEKRAFRKEKRAIRLDNKRSKVEARKTDSQVKLVQATALTAVTSEAPAAAPQAAAKNNLPLILGGVAAFILLLVGVFIITKK